MNTEEIMKLADAYAAALVIERGDTCTVTEDVVGKITAVMQARAALEAALSAKQGEQERPTFDEWTSAHTRANLHKLKPAAKQEPNYELLRLLETAEQDLQAIEQRQHSNPEMLAVHIRANLRKAIDLCVIDVAKVGFRQALAHPAPVNQQLLEAQAEMLASIKELKAQNAQERDPFIAASAKLNAELMAQNFQKDERISELEAQNAQMLEALKLASVMLKTGTPEYDERDAIEVIDAAIAAVEGDV